MDPILLELGPLQLRYYGLMYAIGLLLTVKIMEREVVRTGIKMKKDDVFTMIVLIFTGGIIGARAYYVAFNLDYYFGPRVPWYEFTAVWHGGLAIHGGVLAGALSLWIYAKKKDLSFLQLADIGMPPVILAQAIGRIGNLMNGDAHGYPTDMPWGIVFKYGPASQEFPGQALHPVMIYESILNLAAFLILFFVIRKRGYKHGFVAASYVIAYSVIRFIVSFYRADDLYMFGLRAPHIISIIGLLIGLGMIITMKLYNKQDISAT